MLFDLTKKVDFYNPLKAVYQFVLIGIAGTCFYLFGDVDLIGTNQVKTYNIVSATAITDVSKILSNKTLQEKEKIYKVIVGISEYLKNSERIHSNRTLRDVTVEVFLTYKMESYKELDTLIVKKSEEAGLLKDDSLIKVKDKAIKVFEDLSEEIKIDIENTKVK